MRFRGGGVGHSATRRATDFFKQDRHKLDVDRQHGNAEFSFETELDNTKDYEEDEGTISEEEEWEDFSDEGSNDGEDDKDDSGGCEEYEDELGECGFGSL